MVVVEVAAGMVGPPTPWEARSSCRAGANSSDLASGLVMSDGVACPPDPVPATAPPPNRCLAHISFHVHSSSSRRRQNLLTQLARASVRGESTNESTCSEISSGRSRRKSRLRRGEMWCERRRSSGVLRIGSRDESRDSLAEGVRWVNVASTDATAASSAGTKPEPKQAIQFQSASAPARVILPRQTEAEDTTGWAGWPLIIAQARPLLPLTSPSDRQSPNKSTPGLLHSPFRESRAEKKPDPKPTPPTSLGRGLGAGVGGDTAMLIVSGDGPGPPPTPPVPSPPDDPGGEDDGFLTSIDAGVLDS